MTATAISESCATIHTVMQHANEAVPQREPQEHMEEDDEARRQRRFRRRAIDGVVLGPQLKQLVEEAEVDAEVGEHAPGDERGSRKDHLVVGREDRGQEDAPAGR